MSFSWPLLKTVYCQSWTITWRCLKTSSLIIFGLAVPLVIFLMVIFSVILLAIISAFGFSIKHMSYIVVMPIVGIATSLIAAAITAGYTVLMSHITIHFLRVESHFSTTESPWPIAKQPFPMPYGKIKQLFFSGIKEYFFAFLIGLIITLGLSVIIGFPHWLFANHSNPQFLHWIGTVWALKLNQLYSSYGEILRATSYGLDFIFATVVMLWSVAVVWGHCSPWSAIKLSAQRFKENPLEFFIINGSFWALTFSIGKLDRLLIHHAGPIHGVGNHLMDGFSFIFMSFLFIATYGIIGCLQSVALFAYSWHKFGPPVSIRTSTISMDDER